MDIWELHEYYIMEIIRLYAYYIFKGDELKDKDSLSFLESVVAMQ